MARTGKAKNPTSVATPRVLSQHVNVVPSSACAEICRYNVSVLFPASGTGNKVVETVTETSASPQALCFVRRYRPSAPQPGSTLDAGGHPGGSVPAGGPPGHAMTVLSQ